MSELTPALNHTLLALPLFHTATLASQPHRVGIF